jgi:DNA polymerase III subunit beta
MKVTVERAELLKSLGHVHRVVERRNTIPILANVLIKADKGKLSLKATDLDLEVTDSIASEVSPGGSTTVPAHMFYEIVRKLPEGAQIVIEGSGDRAVLSIRAGRSRFTLQTLPESDFPDLAAGEMTHSFKLAAADLKRLIDKTQFAISTEETRYYLNGIYLHAAGAAKAQMLRAVATDGHRLSWCEVELKGKARELQQIILPRKGVLELQRLLDGEGDIEIAIGSNHIRVQIGEVRFTSKLIDGKFPEYGRVIPAAPPRIMTAPREAMRATLQRTSILSNEKYRGVRLTFAAGLLTVQAHNPEQEEAEDQLEVGFTGEEIEIGFNVSYLLDALAAIDADTVEVGLTDANSSCLIRKPGDATVKYVVMPMRL